MSGWIPDEFEPGLVSVVIPTCNRAGLLAETLESLFNQTHDRVEVLLVDDGSEDATSATTESWSKRFGSRKSWRFKLIRQEHLGAQAARNRGTRESRGEFINYLDDDDLLAEDKIALQVQAARRSDADLVCGPYAYFVRDEHGYGLRPPQGGRQPDAGGSLFEAWLRGWSWYVMAGLLRRELVNRAGPWDESMLCCQDLAFAASCLSVEPRLAPSPASMLYRRHHAGSVSNRSFAKYEDSLIRFAQTIEKLALDRLPPERAGPALAQYLGRHAIRFFAKGSTRGAAFCTTKVGEYDPDYRPDRSGLSTRLAYALGGFRLWAWKNRMRDRFKTLGRSLRGKREGYRPVPTLWVPRTEKAPPHG